MKKLILFIVVFLFLYNFQFKAFPLDNSRILQGLGFLTLLFNEKDFIRLLTNRKVKQFLGWAIGYLLFSIFAQFQMNIGRDLTFIVKPVNVFMFFFSSYFIYQLTKYTYGKVNVGIILYYIVLAGVAQALISGIFYFNADAYHTFVSLSNEKQGAGGEHQLMNLGKRFMGIGNRYVGGAVRLGFAFLALLVLPYVHNNRITRYKFLYWLSFFLIVIAGILTARTFFVMMGLGFLLILRIKIKTVLQFIKFNFKIILSIIIGIPVLYYIATLFIEPTILKPTLNWAFEIFINYSEGQGLSSSSTKALKNMYVFPHSLKTWLMGDALYMDPSGSGYYMGTDVGYLRMIFYFGLPATIYFVIMLWRYYKILADLTTQKALKYVFGILIIATVVINIKVINFFSEYFVLFLVFLVLPKYSSALKDIKKNL